MVEKKEQLKLTRARLKTLNERIGKNIIKSFQTTYPKDVVDPQKEKTNEDNFPGMSEAEQIEEILEEANAYNLRWEVKDTAEKSLKESDLKGVWLSRIDAYVRAYHEWIK